MSKAIKKCIFTISLKILITNDVFHLKNNAFQVLEKYIPIYL